MVVLQNPTSSGVRNTNTERIRPVCKQGNSSDRLSKPVYLGVKTKGECTAQEKHPCL